jgi:hypothetical protein
VGHASAALAVGGFDGRVSVGDEIGGTEFVVACGLELPHDVRTAAAAISPIAARPLAIGLFSAEMTP